MRRSTWSLTGGFVILISGSLALLLSAGVVKTVRAQAPTPANSPMPQPPAAPATEKLAGPELSPPVPGAPELLPAMTPLDATGDPGLRSSNPEGFVYDPSGRRDPFFPPSSLMRSTPEIVQPGTPTPMPVADEGVLGGDPLVSYYLRDFKLVGVLWDVKEPRAMIRAPNNRIYTVQLKMKMGRENAVVAAIREKEIVLVQPDQSGNYKTGEARTLRMRN